MDKKLLIGATTLLIFEILFLMGDLNLLPFKFMYFEKEKQSFEIIGAIGDTKQNVKRKSQDSPMWEDTNKQDSIYAYDSILTLANSSAKLSLNGNINIQLHENTLIVMEPSSEDTDGEFKLKFSRGHFRSNNENTFNFGAGNWSIQAQKGTDLSLRKTIDGQLEMEVTKGKVELENKTSKQKVDAQNKKIIFSENKLVEEQSISNNLAWDHPKDIRLYTHSDNTDFYLKWQGQADSININKQGQKDHKVNTANKNQLGLKLKLGTYHFTLKNKTGVSKSLAVHVWPAEKIQHFSPLPRSRFELNANETFSWSKQKNAKSYYLQFSDRSNFSHITNNIPVDTNITNLALQEEGQLYWRVIGIDEEGFTIPPTYYYSLDGVSDPLQAPVLNQPKLRQPAQKKKTPDSGWWQKPINNIFDLIFPKAHANNNATTDEILFNWEDVNGADHYVIEISSSATFEKPELISKVKKSEFNWGQFSKKVYYWRVAAGQDSGRKGLFSQPQRIDLSQLEKVTPGEISPGVTLVKKTVPQPKPAPPPVKAPEPVVQKAATTPPPPPPLEKEDKEWIFDLWTNISYMYYIQETSSFLSVNMSGLNYPFVFLRANIPLKENGSLIFQSSYETTKWKAQSTSELPFQQEFEVTVTPWLLHYRPYGTNFSIGYTAKQLPLVQRSNNEEVSVKVQNVDNLSFELQYAYGTYAAKHLIQLGLFDKDFQNYSFLNKFQTPLGTNGKAYWGGNFDLDIIKGDFVSTAIQTNIGLLIGTEF